MKLLKDLDVSGKYVFVRADLDVPLTSIEDSVKKLKSDEATRLKNLKPTIDFLLSKNCKIVIAGHIDRPSARLVNGKAVIDPALSTKNLLKPLKDYLSREIVFREDFGKRLDTPLTLFENLRFWPGEVENSMEFASQLASLADIYINEAFGNSHRNHASMVALPALLPHAAGLHLAQEVDQLNKLIKNPTRPFIAIIGGAKIETKVPLIENLSKVADLVLVGGELPVEIALNGQRFSANVKVATLREDKKELSDKSSGEFEKLIKGAKTVVWNGPLGLFEEGQSQATLKISEAIIQSGAYSVVGGGETTQFLTQFGLISKFSFVSAGGGAMLEFLAGKELPGIKALE